MTQAVGDGVQGPIVESLLASGLQEDCPLELGEGGGEKLELSAEAAEGIGTEAFAEYAGGLNTYLQVLSPAHQLLATLSSQGAFDMPSAQTRALALGCHSGKDSLHRTHMVQPVYMQAFERLRLQAALSVACFSLHMSYQVKLTEFTHLKTGVLQRHPTHDARCWRGACSQRVCTCWASRRRRGRCSSICRPTLATTCRRAPLTRWSAPAMEASLLSGSAWSAPTTRSGAVPYYPGGPECAGLMLLYRAQFRPSGTSPFVCKGHQVITRRPSRARQNPLPRARKVAARQPWRRPATIARSRTLYEPAEYALAGMWL